MSMLVPCAFHVVCGISGIQQIPVVLLLTKLFLVQWQKPRKKVFKPSSKVGAGQKHLFVKVTQSGQSNSLPTDGKPSSESLGLSVIKLVEKLPLESICESHSIGLVQLSSPQMAKQVQKVWDLVSQLVEKLALESIQSRLLCPQNHLEAVQKGNCLSTLCFELFFSLQ